MCVCGCAGSVLCSHQHTLGTPVYVTHGFVAVSASRQMTTHSAFACVLCRCDRIDREHAIRFGCRTNRLLVSWIIASHHTHTYTPTHVHTHNFRSLQCIFAVQCKMYVGSLALHELSRLFSSNTLPAAVNLLARHRRALVVGEFDVAVAGRRRPQRLVSDRRHIGRPLR